MDGQKDQRVQHLHRSHQLYQRYLFVSFHLGLQSTGKSFRALCEQFQY